MKYRGEGLHSSGVILRGGASVSLTPAQSPVESSAERMGQTQANRCESVLTTQHVYLETIAELMSVSGRKIDESGFEEDPNPTLPVRLCNAETPTEGHQTRREMFAGTFSTEISLKRNIIEVSNSTVGANQMLRNEENRRRSSSRLKKNSELKIRCSPNPTYCRREGVCELSLGLSPHNMGQSPLRAGIAENSASHSSISAGSGVNNDDPPEGNHYGDNSSSRTGSKLTRKRDAIAISSTESINNSGTGATKKRSISSIKRFPGKLHDMLTYCENEGVTSCLRWINDGTAFAIFDMEELKNVLPIFFGHSRYSSLQRQLSTWRFSRIFNSKFPAYSHPLFLKGRKADCESLCCVDFQSIDTRTLEINEMFKKQEEKQSMQVFKLTASPQTEESSQTANAASASSRILPREGGVIESSDSLSRSAISPISNPPSGLSRSRPQIADVSCTVNCAPSEMNHPLRTMSNTNQNKSNGSEIENDFTGTSDVAKGRDVLAGIQPDVRSLFLDQALHFHRQQASVAFESVCRQQLFLAAIESQRNAVLARLQIQTSEIALCDQWLRSSPMWTYPVQFAPQIQEYPMPMTQDCLSSSLNQEVFGSSSNTGFSNGGPRGSTVGRSHLDIGGTFPSLATDPIAPELSAFQSTPDSVLSDRSGIFDSRSRDIIPGVQCSSNLLSATVPSVAQVGFEYEDGDALFDPDATDPSREVVMEQGGNDKNHAFFTCFSSF